MLKNLSIRSKIIIAFTIVAIAAVGIIGFFAFTTGSSTLEEESFNKLTAVREMKASQIEDYFQLIENQVVTFSEDRMIIEAMRAFDEELHKLDSELGITDEEMVDIDARLRSYYQHEFIPRLTQNILRDVSLDDYWPIDEDTRILQDLYISSNPFETGSKYLLDNAGDGSSYSEAHEIYHPVIRDYLEKFGYYDIFLVDIESGGHISYSVFKEVDYGTSLLYGPYSETNFAEAYRAARDATDKDFIAIVDYEPYAPSYNAPAAFIASPIFDGDEKIGVLVFQMPIDRIDGIMTNNQNWSAVGLGNSGETYLVGDDFLLRNQSRFLIEDSDNYFNMLEEIGTPLTTIASIRNFNSTIGLQEIDTQGTRAALEGQTSTAIFPDYRGVPVLSSYKPLDIRDVNWVIMSEIDRAEAFAAIQELGMKTGLAVVIMMAIIILLAFLFSRTITKPLEELTEKAHELSYGNLDVKIGFRERGDEIGKLAKSFETMRYSIKQLFGDLEDINKNLEQKVIERTAELEQANERVRSVIDSAPDAIITIDSNQTIVMFNPSAENIFGYAADEVIGQPLTMLMPSSAKDIHPAHVKDFRASDLSIAFMENRPNINGKRKDGTIFPAEASIAKMKLGDDQFFTAILRDVSERIVAEAQLHLQSSALRSAANGIVITNPDGSIQWANPAFTNLTGYAIEEAIGQNPRVLRSGEHDQVFYKKMWDTIKSGKTWHGEVVNKRKDGSLYPEEMTITPVLDAKGNIVNYVAIKQDITERKKMEARLQEAFQTIKVQKERMEVELNFAREIQMSLLPLIFPAFPTRHELSVYATLESAREVGGDFYDFYFLDDDHLCFVIGDVSGKGAPGALLMAVSKTLIKSRAADDHKPASILTHVNDELSRDNTSSMFVTVFLGIINIKTGEVEYTNAGHNPPYIRRADGTVEKVDAFHGPVIGAMPGLPYKQDGIRLDKGDIILLYTDGVTEAFNEAEQLFSDQRLVDLLNEDKLDTSERIVQFIASDVIQFQGEAEQADDITILAVQYRGPIDEVESSKLEIVIKNRKEDLGIVEDQFYEFAGQNAIPDSIRQKVSIVLDEMLNNIVSYAYVDDGEYDIEVDIELSGKRLVLTIKDEGVPFNPFVKGTPDISASVDQREVGGLGIHLVRSVMDEYLYQRQINKNVVTLVKFIEQ